MTWVKIDEDFAQHPKVLEAGPLGMAMQVAGLCYCNRLKTNGHISRAAAMGLLSFEGLGMRMWVGEMFGGGEDASWELVVEDLTEAGVWHKSGHDCADCPPVPLGAFYIHHYLDYQPSKEQVEADRQAKVEAGRKGGQASAEARAKARGRTGAQASGAADAQAESKPDPVSGSVSETSSSSGSSSTSGSRGTLVEEEDERIGEAVEKIVDRRRRSARNPITVMSKWLETVRADVRSTYVVRMQETLEFAPDISAEQLADRFEPDPLAPSKPLAVVYRCETCKDQAQVRNDDDLDRPAMVPCPNCATAVPA